MEILLLSSYFQSAHATANGLCARSVRDALCKLGHHVTVICYASHQEGAGEPDVIEVGEKKELRYYGSNIGVRIKSYTDSIRSLFRPYSDRKLKDAYKTAAVEVMHNKKIDMIVAFYFPLETLIAASELKAEYPDIKTVTYELDSMGDGISKNSALEGMKTKVFEHYVDRLYSHIDQIIVMRAHEAFWRQTHERHLRKVQIADIPMILMDTGPKGEIVCERDYFECIYAGLLDTNYRNPQYFLMLLSEINRDAIFLKAHFYSKGDCEETLKEVEEKTGYLKTHGYVSKEILDCASERTSCFISLGNANSKSVPSKIFSYISKVKPIIHLSTQENDVCIDYFSRYPLALVLREGDGLEENAEKIRRFLANCAERTVEVKGITETFRENTPSFSANLIVSAAISQTDSSYGTTRKTTLKQKNRTARRY